MGQFSKVPRTKIDWHFSEKGIGAWEGCFIEMFIKHSLKLPLLQIDWWFYLIKVRKKGFLNDNILAVLEGERERGTYSKQAFFILLDWPWGGHLFNGN